MTPTGRTYAAMAYLAAVVFAAAIGFDLLGMPVQVYDSVDEILDAQASPSPAAMFRAALVEDRAHLRPLRSAQTKLLFDAAGGRYRLAYRGFHAALLLIGLVLFTRALRVSTAADLASAVFALTVLIGLHTFRGTVQEAFPINHFLEVVVCCLIALNLAQSRGGPWIDAAAVLAFIAASLTLESGLLVWVVALAAWVAGFRGISGRAVAAMTVLLGAYVGLSFAYLDVQGSGFAGQSSGFLLSEIDAAEQRARFGNPPLLFYAYNSAASLMSVLFSEPQDGVFVGVRAWLAGELPPRVWVAVGSSLLTTALVASAVARMVRGRALPGDDGRLLFVCGAVMAGNAAIGFAYAKDEIMSTGGAFYALAAYVAVRSIVARGATMRPLAGAALALIVLAAGSAWAVRSAGVHHVLRSQAFKHRNDWAMLPTLWRQAGRWPQDPAAVRLVLELRSDALAVPAPNPRFEARWAYSVWGD